MDPAERQEIWEQNHLNELQRNITLEQEDPWHYLEKCTLPEHSTLIQDEIEQMYMIDQIEKIEEEKLQLQNNVPQIQLKH